MNSTAVKLLARLRDEGVQLNIEGTSLRVRFAKRIPKEVKRSIVANKAALLALLRSEAAAEEIGTIASHQRFQWIKTPSGPAKIWGFLKHGRVGVVPKGHSQVVWIRRGEMSIYRPETERG